MNLSSKQVVQKLRDDEEDLCSGKLDLQERIREVDMAYGKIQLDQGVTSESLYDSCALRMISSYVNRRTKNLQSSLVSFKPKEFAEKLQKYLSDSLVSRPRSKTADLVDPWVKLGEIFKTKICSSPALHHIYGTFDPGTVEFPKKARKMREKDVLGKEVAPKSTNLNENNSDQDVTTFEAERILSILKSCNVKNEGAVCYFEFVVDPQSFSRTVEHMFYVSMLLKHGCVKMELDHEKLPTLSYVAEDEQTESDASFRQSILSISESDWKDIINAFKIKRCVIPPRRRQK